MRFLLPTVMALALAGCGAARSPSRVVVRDRGDDVVAAVALPPDGRFTLAYRHSVYEAPAQERFRAIAGRRFELEAIASTSAEVIEYYAVGGLTRRDGEWLVLTPTHRRRMPGLALAATQLGRRTLVVGDREWPLYRDGERAAHLRIAVEGT